MLQGSSTIDIIKKIINFITTIVFLLIVSAIAFALISIKFSDTEKEVNFFGYVSYNVLTDSMYPTFDAGAFIIVKTNIDKEELNIGDIIAFIPNTDRDHTKVTHRIVDRQIVDGNPSYITRGDKNGTDDPPIQTGQVIGKVVFHIDGVGEQLMNMNNSYFLGAVVVLIILLLALPYLTNEY